MKIIITCFLLFASSLYAQTKEELLILLNDHGKINLVPMYGEGKVEKTEDLKEADRKIIEDETKQFGTKDSACIMFNRTAWNYFYEGDLKIAMRRFNQAWLLDSNNASEYFGFSAILEVIKENPDSYFETSVKITSVDDPKKYYDLGIKKDKNNEYEIYSLYFTSTGFQTYGKTDLALKASDRLLELTPNDTLALRQRGYLYIVKKEWDKAISDFELAFQYGCRDFRLFNDLGYSYQEKGDFANAFINYEKSYTINPSFLNALYNNTILRLKLSQFDKALESIDKCISVKGDVGDFHKTKGEILIKLNRKEEGIVCLKKAKNLETRMQNS